MTNQNIEPVGIKAIIEGLSKYLSGTRQMQAANAAVASSEVNLERVSVASANRIIAARTSVAAAERSLAVVTRTSNRAYELARTRLAQVEQGVATTIVQAQLKVEAAQAKAAASAQGSAAAQQRAILALAAAERNLERARIAGSARIIAAQVAVRNAYTSKVEKISAAESTVQAVVSRSNAAQLAAAAATAKGGLAAKGAAGATGIFARAQQGLNNATTAVGKSLIAVTGFSNRFAVSLRFGAATAAAFIAALAIGAASKFQQQLVKIDVLTNATTEQTKLLGDSFIRLSQVVPKSADELGAAAYVVLSSGIKDTSEALNIVTQAAKASSIGVGSTQDVARVTTSVINAYGKENITAAQATDILVAAVKAGSAEATDFAGEIGRLLGIAPTLGITFDQLAASVAALTNVGIPSSQAVTALLGIMNQLISPSKQAEDRLKEFGTSIEEVRKAIREKGLTTAMQDLINLFGGNIQAFEDLFPEVRGLTGALLLFGSQAEANNQILKEVQDSAGITDKGFQQMNKTFGAQSTILRNQLNVLLLQLGTVILPPLTTAIGGLITVFQNLGNVDLGPFDNLALDFGKSLIERIFAVINAFTEFFRAISSGVKAVKAIFRGDWADAWRNFKDVGRHALISFLNEIVTLMPILPNTVIKAVEDAANGVLRIIEDLSRKAADTKILGKDINPLPALAEGQLGNISLPRIQAPDIFKSMNDEISKTGDSAQDATNKLKGLPPTFNDTATAEAGALTITEALKDGIIDFSEAAELGINALQAGALEATVIQRDSEEAAFNFTKTLSRVANAFDKSREAAEKTVLALARESLSKIKAAQQALFSGPTQEVAALELQLSKLQAKRAEAAARIQPQLEALQDQLDALHKRQTDAKKGPTDNPQVAEVLQKGLTDAARQGSSLGENFKDEEAAIQSQIDALNRELELSSRESDAVQRNIDVLTSQSDILQAQIALADKTLLTQDEQRKKAQEVIDATAQQSQAVRDLALKVNKDVIPEMDDMRAAIDLTNKAIDILNNDSIRSKFIVALDDASLALGGFTKTVKAKLEDLQSSAEINRLAASGGSAEIPAGSSSFFGEGGFIRHPTLSVLGEGSRPELVLPLSQPSRSRELVNTMPPNLASQIFGRASQSGGRIIGDINVSGFTLEQMRVAARTEVDRAFRQQRNGFRRNGI